MFLLVAGPGLVVMLADTDAGSVITAAQSGARWGYRLLLLQVLLIPVLYVVQELTVRLGLVSGRGHGELIQERFGRGWAWLSVSTLVLACLGALISELSGMAGVGLLYGIPTWLTMLLTLALILTVVWTGSYHSVERIAILLGLFEFAFLWVAWRAHPEAARLVDGITHLPLGDPQYLYLAAANIGAVIMPWMVFYQQSAVVDKGLGPEQLRAARLDTAIGAVVTQVIMAAVLIAAAATIGRVRPDAALDTVQQIAAALTPYLGADAGRAVFAVGMSGAALVATLVVMLAAAWGLGEVTGYRRSLEHHPRDAPWFYGTFSAGLILGAIVVGSGINLVTLNVAVEVMNALLLPVVLGFLFLLAHKALPEPYRLRGAYAWIVGAVILVTAGFGVYAGLSGVFG
ncbi:MAG: NRAMP family divalent metal transporter [Gammaproteobacteria bacterium]|nr:divalent metal cation transporter [Gammaproteobacteria bacterium]